MTEYLPLLALLVVMVWVVGPIVLGKLLRGPSTQEREAVTNAPPRKRAVVAGSDLDPLEALWRAPAYGEERAS